MLTKNNTLLILAISALLVACSGNKATMTPAEVNFNNEALYPEGVVWDSKNQRFLVTSIRKGVIGSVKDDGSYWVFAKDPRMISTVGIKIDQARDRVLVCNSDAGAGEKTTKATAGKIAALAVFQLSNGKLIKYVDLVKGKDGGHFCNDITITKDGTAYITDSFAPTIYKVDSNYNASVLISDKAFSGKSFNLNGIVNKDNYLLVAKMNSGQLFKVPLDNPRGFTEVSLPEKVEGVDGLLWAADGSLILIANNNAHVGVPASAATNAVMRLTTADGWKTASIKGKEATGDVFASTGTLRDGQVYVTHAMLHVLFNPKTKKHLADFKIRKYNP